MSSGYTKGTQIYYPFLSKFPASESPPGSPAGPLWREMSVSRAFLNISSRVSCKEAPLPHRSPPNWASSERKAQFLEPLHASHKFSDRWAHFQVPQRGPYGNRRPSPVLFYLSTKVSSKGALPPGSLHRASVKKDAPNPEHHSAISQISPVEKPTPGCPTEPPWREMPVPRAFLS